MTVAQFITKRPRAISSATERKVLSRVRKLEISSDGIHQRNGKSKSPEVQEEAYIPKDRALRAFAGLWKDRKDLRKDPVQALKVIRARMRSPGRRHA